jgi:small subunit ribosomal protein S16
LEKGGLIEKTVRSAEVVGKAKQAEARKAGAKQVAKQAAEAKPEEAVEEKAAEAPTDETEA